MRQVGRFMGGGMLVFICASLWCGPVRATAAETEQQVRIKVPAANVREAPGTESRVVFQVRKGETFKLVETKGEWLLIEGPDGKHGYVLNRLVDLQAIAPPPAPAAPVAEPIPAPPATPAVAIDHKEVSCVLVDQYPKIDACLTPAQGVGRAQLHFRAAETDPWYAVDLKPEGSCYSAYLPKPTAALSGFEYYVFAMNKGFAEVDRPEGAPGKSYRVKVVKREKECSSTVGRLARGVKKTVAPVVVSVARNAAGLLLDATAARKIEAGAALVGFSTAGVLIASTGAAPVVAAAAAGGAAAASGGAAAGSTAAATAGGISTKTMLIAGGAVVAGGTIIAVAASGGSDTPSAPACSAQQVVDQANVQSSPFRPFAPNNDTFCLDTTTGPYSYGRCTALCVSGVCNGQCTMYWQRSDGSRFNMQSYSCAPGSVPNTANAFGESMQVISFCGMIR